MKDLSFRILSVLLSLIMLFCIVACNEQAQVTPVPTPTPEPEPEVELTTKYYMPNGWASKYTTPVWTTKDENTVDTSNISLVLGGDGKTEVTNVTPELKAALAEALATPDYFKDVKNIIIIISDGMGISHVQASEYWSGELIMTKLPNVGASMTLTREGITTDSCAGGTAISTGYKTTSGFINMDAEGNNLKTVTELAREKGMLVGIVTNAELEDATPADFSVHSKNRVQGWTKNRQMQIVFGADLFMGNSGNEYNNDINGVMKDFAEPGLGHYTSGSKVVSNFNNDKNTKMWALFDTTANEFARFDTTKKTTLPNLQQMTAYAISWLDAHEKEDQGFIIMIENTYTDHFGHGKIPYDGSTNTYGIVKEVQSTDEAVAIALKYVLEHPDTALIVTADHETGNTTLRPGWKDDFSNIKASSGNHSNQNVPVFAIGKGTEELNTLTRTEEERAAGARWDEATAYENCVIGQVIGHLLGDPNFGGNNQEDTSGKTSAKFDVNVTAAASTLTYTLDLQGVPIRSGNFVQFKIKPVSKTDSIKVELANAGTVAGTLLNATVFSTTDANTIAKDADSNVTTAMMKAYKQAFVQDSGLADGWYQVSVAAPVGAEQIVITLTGSFAAGSKIGMDDLTIQYGSTVGELKFSSTNATATGTCLVTD